MLWLSTLWLQYCWILWATGTAARHWTGLLKQLTGQKQGSWPIRPFLCDYYIISTCYESNNVSGMTYYNICYYYICYHIITCYYSEAEVRRSFLLPRQSPRSQHKGATGRVWTGDQRHPVLCHCQLGQDISSNNGPLLYWIMLITDLLLQ